MSALSTTAVPATQQEVEEWVAAQYRALNLPATSPDSDFFGLGGTSLAAMRLIAKVEEVFGEGTLPPDDLYDNTTVRAMAALISANAATNPS